MPDGNDINTHISPNLSKLLNIQAQMDWGTSNGDDKHAKGFSGGTRLFYAVIDGVRYDVAYKLEKAGKSNRFPFMSFVACDDSGKSIRMTKFPLTKAMNWLIDNWDEVVVPAANEHGCDLCNATKERLQDSFSCGPHLLLSLIHI